MILSFCNDVIKIVVSICAGLEATVGSEGSPGVKGVQEEQGKELENKLIEDVVSILPSHMQLISGHYAIPGLS